MQPLTTKPPSPMKDRINNGQYIKDTAKKLGFDACGIASPKVLENDIAYYNKWIADNKHGNIAYLEKNIEKRADPTKILKNTKSVIALVQSYYPPKKQHADAHYKIAKYAYGNDYHTVMKTKANLLIETLQKKLKTAEFKVFVDSNTILEKAWAARCGLGWIGKNTLLINKELGSFVFICIILTDLDLNYDEIHDDHCGNCSACIMACPTGAIEKPHQLNASKCLAYLTIENTSSENKEDKGKTKGWIYGCDICQDVCPWNNEIPSTKEEGFLPNTALLKMKKDDFETLNETTFEKLFKNSAIKRIGLKKLKSNIENA
jgi:epoxyqueuosine reductase